MKEEKTYSEKLKSPKWQKKRLEIMGRDKFTCKFCGDKETTLHVHHKKYCQNGNPWDVNNDDLITFCEDCHLLFSSVEGSDKMLDAKAIKISNPEKYPDVYYFISIKSPEFGVGFYYIHFDSSRKICYYQHFGNKFGSFNRILDLFKSIKKDE